MEGSGLKKSVTLTTMFTAAVTAVVFGIPTDFISEFFIFPFYHNSTLGGELTALSNGLFLPFYEAVGEFFGYASVLNGDPSLPSVDF